MTTTIGVQVAKRQAEELARVSVIDFEVFYNEREWEPERVEQLLVLTFDGAGIIMRNESLRSKARRNAEQAASEPKAWPERTGTGEKLNHKRMAEVASVYSIASHE